MNSTRWARCVAAAALALMSTLLAAKPIAINGTLDVVADDSGGTATFSGVAAGTVFSGAIDDVSASGSLSGGGVSVPFGCCIAAGGLSVTNDMTLDADDAALLNALAGGGFSAGSVVDVIDLEGDSTTPGGGRIEIGLSWLFDADTLVDDSLDNYPFDPVDLRLALFFVFEEDEFGNDLYNAAGLLAPVPEPGSAALMLAGGVLLWRRLRGRRA